MQKEFTKSDLKDGMVVEYRSGGLLLKIGKKLVGTHSINSTDAYRDDLTHKLISEMDIAKVYKLGTINKVHDIFKKDFLDIIWEAGVNHMTVDEMKAKLEELTGKKIEIKQEADYYGMLSGLSEYCNKQDNCLHCQFCGRCPVGIPHKKNEEFVKQCYEKVMGNGNN